MKIDNYKKERIIENKKRDLEDYEKVASDLDELEFALRNYKYKVIDKRFFEKYFTVEKGGHKYTRFRITLKPCSDYNRIFVGQGQGGYDVVIGNRDREHVHDNVKRAFDMFMEKIKEQKEEIRKIEEYDYMQLQKDLIALRQFVPQALWLAALEEYPVKWG